VSKWLDREDLHSIFEVVKPGISRDLHRSIYSGIIIA
jgi:hypothetical protein